MFKMLNNVKIFKDTQFVCQSDDNISNAIIHTQDSTQYYSSQQVSNWISYKEQIPPTFDKTNISFSKNKSFTAAKSFVNSANAIAVLNFANAVHPGGGVTYGMSAQEEDLCRCSNLYPVLSSKFGVMPKYYKDGLEQKEKSNLMNAAIMYSPGIIVLRDDMDNYKMFDVYERFMVDVITCAAPYLNLVSDFSDEMLMSFHLNKGKAILDVALKNHADVVILGAFGCGAFRNDPTIVAKAYKQLVAEFDGYFKEIQFAIYGDKNYEIFEKIIIS